MVTRTNSGVNKYLLLATALLMFFGIVVVYTSTTAHANAQGFSTEYYLSEHLLKMLIAIGAMVFGALVDYSFWKKFGRIIFIIGAVLVICALIKGPEIKGAHRWIWGIQPSEILKFGLICFVSIKLSEANSEEIKTTKCTLIQPAIPYGIAIILLALQPNFSMAVIFSIIVVAVLFVAKVNYNKLFRMGFVVLLIAIPVLLLKDHTRKRIEAFFDPNANSGSALQGERAITALGNGGFWGMGAGDGLMKQGYLPEAHKDVVYSVIGEEFGFKFTLIVLFLFGVIFYQGFEIAQKSSTRFGKYIAVAIIVSLFSNFFIHVGMCTGILPSTGQPLPFLSYGGTNLIMSCLFIGILLNISKSTTGKKISEPFDGTSFGMNS